MRCESNSSRNRACVPSPRPHRLHRDISESEVISESSVCLLGHVLESSYRVRGGMC